MSNEIKGLINITTGVGIPDADVRYSLLTTTESISGSLQSQINLKQNEITLVAGTNVTITESPADTWTINASISGGTVNTLNSFTTTTSGSYSVSASDNVVYVDNANTITLPASPATDESHWIVNTYTVDITINGNGKNISVDGISYPTLALTPDSSLHLHYNASKTNWYVI